MTEHEQRVLWSEEQLDEALRTLDSGDAGDLSGPRAALQRALAAPQAPQAPQPMVRRHRRWPYAAVAAGVAVLAAAALVATDPFGGQPARHVQGRQSSATAPNTGTTTVVTAAGALDLAADHTSTVADVTAKPGQFLYVDNKVVSVSQDLGVAAWRQTLRTQTWVPSNESATWTQTYSRIGSVQWLVGSAAKEGDISKKGAPVGTVTAACGDFRSNDLGTEPSCDRPNDWQQTTSAMLAKLPRDPHKLLAQLSDGQQLNTDTEYSVLQRSWLILQSGLVRADLRATIYRMLALLPDLKVTQQDANLDGRHGTALGITAGGNRLDVILDPSSSQLIGMRLVQTAAGNGLPAGTVVDESSFQVKVVGSAGATS